MKDIIIHWQMHGPVHLASAGTVKGRDFLNAWTGQNLQIEGWTLPHQSTTLFILDARRAGLRVAETRITKTHNETRRAIHSRICARWHAGSKNFSTAGLNEPRIECTGDLYNWLENLTDVEVIDALESQTI